MRTAFVGVTGDRWYELLSNRPHLTEANFWQHSGRGRFNVLNAGDLFLFELHAPNNCVVGGISERPARQASRDVL
jgi:putative restriction endonuclease